MRDLHTSLKNQVLGTQHSKRAEVTLVQLQWSKEDVGYSLHVNPSTWSSAGIQITDFLNYLGFQRAQCSFVPIGQCYVTSVREGFDLNKFVAQFDEAFGNLESAEKDLEACGFFLDQPEGWGYFFGKSSRPRQPDLSMPGDGHSAQSIKPMKVSEDENFHYRFTWVETGHGKGWVVHYRPKHPPLSAEIAAVFKFLGLSEFSQCPEFDFEPCSWRSIAFAERGHSIFDSNANVAHGWFDAHATRFSPGIEKLLASHGAMESVGFNILKFPEPAARLDAEISRKVMRPTKGTPTKGAPVDLRSFDVAISFAGSERKYAEELASMLQSAGFSVFYDEFYPEYLWGKNLVDTFEEIYRKRARYCVIFVSKEYAERVWTNHERQSAQARALQEKGNEYILPIKVDETELKGMPPTVGYMPISKGVPTIGAILIKKLGGVGKA